MTPDDERLIQALNAIRWPIAYGSVTIMLREGKPTLVKVEKTIKLD